MSKKKLSKLLALYLPYVVIGLVATNLGEAWRLAVGKELGDKIVSLMDTLPVSYTHLLTPNEYRRQVRQGQRPAPAKRHEG